MIDDLDIQHAARLLVEQQGANAVDYAKEWVRAMTDVGNADGARTLQHVIKAIDKIKTPRAPRNSRRAKRRKLT